MSFPFLQSLSRGEARDKHFTCYGVSEGKKLFEISQSIKPRTLGRIGFKQNPIGAVNCIITPVMANFTGLTQNSEVEADLVFNEGV